MHKGTDEKEFFSKPLDFVEPLHLHPSISAVVSVISSLIMALSFINIAELIWISLVPLWLGLIGRKDKGVFGYGCLTGYTFLFILWLLDSNFCANPIIFSWPLILGFWLWISRKIYFYMAFPKVSQTLADAPREQFLLPWYKLLILAFTLSFIYTALEILFGSFTEQMILAITQTNHTRLIKVSSLTGISGLSFLIIFINLSIALFLEMIFIDRKTIPPWQVLIISVSLTASVLFFANPSSQPELKTHVEPKLILLSSKQDLAPKAIRNKIREGNNLMIIEGQLSPYQTRLATIRSMEFGVPFVIHNQQVILQNEKIIDPIKVPETVNFKPTFYYRNPNFFTNIVFVATFIAFLVTGLHFYKRKSILRNIITGKN